ncbi:hypothetical protein FOL47_003747 [Perkinsus chesapeaki]|uniref:Peptidase A1 domain-containing protein n=1 Tax=Perkinsus chesapeaki TaxID=330153 RepID=A0A7J6M6P8_PERCH|nr:hypothetical protein FOL47_003747 [Perkinsus chesapeaki]
MLHLSKYGIRVTWAARIAKKLLQAAGLASQEKSAISRGFSPSGTGVRCSPAGLQSPKIQAVASRPYLPFLQLLVILCSTAIPMTASQVLRLDITFKIMPQYGYSIFTQLNIRGTALWAIVDTGSSSTMFVWDNWYERQLGRGACRNFPFGCYTCPEPCQPLFDFNDTIKLGDKDIPDLKFSLVMNQDPPPAVDTPFNLLGLASHSRTRIKSLLKQLMRMSPKPIGAKAFAVYLAQRGQGISGELLIGGGDPRVYQHPLHYVKLKSRREYIVMLNSLQVGGGPSKAGIKQDLLIDTGRNTILVPQSNKRFTKLIGNIMKEASEASPSVTFRWQPRLEMWMFPCAYRDIMPPITFGLGDKEVVYISLTHANYVRVIGRECGLGFKGGKSRLWALSGQAIINNYLEFQLEEGRVGIAQLPN